MRSREQACGVVANRKDELQKKEVVYHTAEVRTPETAVAAAAAWMAYRGCQRTQSSCITEQLISYLKKQLFRG